MRCPKCNREIERIEFQSGRQDVIGPSIKLVFICNDCGIYIEKTYEKIGAR